MRFIRFENICIYIYIYVYTEYNILYLYCILLKAGIMCCEYTHTYIHLYRVYSLTPRWWFVRKLRQNLHMHAVQCILAQDYTAGPIWFSIYIYMVYLRSYMCSCARRDDAKRLCIDMRGIQFCLLRFLGFVANGNLCSRCMRARGRVGLRESRVACRHAYARECNNYMYI